MAETDAHLDRIRTVTQTARTTWFGYLGAFAFTGVTLLGVEDVDFFALDSATELPVIGISVPVTYFFGAGALVITVIFIYLHVFLEQLWYALGRAPARVGEEQLAAQVQPWLISSFALNIRRWRRIGDSDGKPCIELTPLGVAGVVASGLLLYGAGPGLMAGLWYRSMPAHDAWMTGGIGVLLGLCIVTAWESGASLMAHMRYPENSGSRAVSLWYGKVRRGVVPVMLAVLVVVSVMRTEWDWRGYKARPGEVETVDGEDVQVPENVRTRFRHWFRPVPADLAEARLVALPGDWLSRADAEKEFYAKWCKRHDTDDCGKTIPEDGAFQTEWLARRKTYLEVQPKPPLRGSDLSFANLDRAFLPGIDLREAVLHRAFMLDARMEGADLSFARMEGANLWGAQMQGADLRWAQMNGAILSEAQMEGAVLRDAQMAGAVLIRAGFS